MVLDLINEEHSAKLDAIEDKVQDVIKGSAAILSINFPESNKIPTNYAERCLSGMAYHNLHFYEIAKRIEGFVYWELNEIYMDIFSEELSFDFKGLIRSKIDYGIVNTIKNTSDEHYQKYKEMFCVRTVFNNILRDFPVSNLNEEHHKEVAKNISFMFIEAKPFKRGLKLVHRYNKDLFSLLDSVYQYTGEQFGLDAVKFFKESPIEAGECQEKYGIQLRRYKGHYTIGLSSDRLKSLLVYLNTFAQEILSECLPVNLSRELT
jgi:hypothetical protein